MSVSTRPLTAAELFDLSSKEAGSVELIAGEVVRMNPTGYDHGHVTMQLSWRVAQQVKERGLGRVLAAETGFVLRRNPDTVRAPDMAFITQQRLDEVGAVDGYWPGCPDLVAEVVSPSDSFSEVEAKALAWLEAGCRVVWVVDPKQRNVTEHRGPSAIRILSSQDRLSAPDLLGDWSVEVGQLFD